MRSVSPTDRIVSAVSQATMNKLCSCRGSSVAAALLSSTGFNPSVFSLRFARKPRWVPVAKSKAFRVAPRQVLSEAEAEELKRLFTSYRASMESIGFFFAEENKRLMDTGAVGLALHKQEDEEFERILAQNDEENARIMERRRERLRQSASDLETRTLSRIEEYNKTQEVLAAKVDAAIAAQMERSKTYLSREDVGRAVEEALANAVDYNFALDLRGNMYRGRKTKSVALKPELIEVWDAEDFQPCLPADDLFSEAKRKREKLVASREEEEETRESLASS